MSMTHCPEYDNRQMKTTTDNDTSFVQVTDTEVMSQIEHTKSRSAFSARDNLSVLTLQFHDNKKEALYRQATVLKCNEGNPEGENKVDLTLLG